MAASPLLEVEGVPGETSMLAHYYAATFGVMQGSAAPAASHCPAVKPVALRTFGAKRRLAEPLRIARLDARLLRHLLIRL